MEREAYSLGTLDAAIAFGVTKEAWAKAVVPLAGAALGAALAPEGEIGEGAVVGGLGALGLQSAALAGGRALAAGGKKAVGAIQSRLGPKPPDTQMLQTAKNVPQPIKDLHHWSDQEKAYQTHQQQTKQTLAPLPQLAQPPVVSPATVAASKHFGTDPALVTAMMNAPGPMKGAPPAMPPADTAKLSVDASMGMGIPGVAGVNIGLREQRERLPGMSRWVPRSTVERGFEYADAGLDPEAVAEIEAKRGRTEHPLMGALLGLGGMRYFGSPGSPLGQVLGGLGGAGLGALYHQLTERSRVEEGLQGYEGAQRERERFPLRRHPVQTANESTPLAVSRGHGDA